MGDKSLLMTILAMVGTAPATQLRCDFAERARALGKDETTTTEMIHQFFAEVAALTDVDASSFVRRLVDPKFTKDYA
jgi:hypothetical protein